MIAERIRRGSDAGTTLLEVVVAMSVMSVLTVVAVTGLVAMHRTTTRAENEAIVQSRTMSAFSRLEREMRYAERIFPAATRGNGEPYVSYRTVDPDGQDRSCVQLTLTATGNLTQRRWTVGTAKPPATTIASGLTAGEGGPFLVTSAQGLPANGSASPYDRLEIRLAARSGGAHAADRSSLTAQFAALNTVPASAGEPACT